MHHQRTRYVFEMFHRRKVISRELYDYCIKEGYADAALIAKWKKVYFKRLLQSQDMKNCVAWGAYNPEIPILVQRVFVEFQETRWMIQR